MKVLVVNIGSSTVKLRLVEEGAVLARSDLRSGSSDVRDAVREAVEGWPPPDVVGHRIVHGGSSFRGPALLDGSAVRKLEDLVPLAPLHQRRCLDGVEQVRELLPGTPHVACFDTAFFADLPAAARTYPVPLDWRERFGIARFGFHGLSHAYAVRKATSDVSPPPRRIVTCHLGSGASLAAVAGGRPLDTTMGFTPLEGIVMATRSGSVDPGMLLWLQTTAGLAAAEVSEALERRSGLAGLAGTADMREALDRSEAGDPAAMLGVDVYVHRLRAGIAAMVAAMDGLDALVFTGGVGENASEVRGKTVSGLSHLGIRLDEKANSSAAGDVRIDADASAVAVMVVSAREELEIADQVGRFWEARPA